MLSLWIMIVSNAVCTFVDVEWIIESHVAGADELKLLSELTYSMVAFIHNVHSLVRW